MSKIVICLEKKEEMYIAELSSRRTMLGKVWNAGQVARMSTSLAGRRSYLHSSRRKALRSIPGMEGSSGGGGGARGRSKRSSYGMFRPLPKRSILSANIVRLARAVKKRALSATDIPLAVKGILVHGLASIYDRKCTYTLGTCVEGGVEWDGWGGVGGRGGRGGGVEKVVILSLIKF